MSGSSWNHTLPLSWSHCKQHLQRKRKPRCWKTSICSQHPFLWAFLFELEGSIWVSSTYQEQDRRVYPQSLPLRCPIMYNIWQTFLEIPGMRFYPLIVEFISPHLSYSIDHFKSYHELWCGEEEVRWWRELYCSLNRNRWNRYKTSLNLT